MLSTFLLKIDRVEIFTTGILAIFTLYAESCEAFCDRVDETPCHGNTKEKTKETNLLRDTGETMVSQGGKDATPQPIKGTGWGRGRSKGAAVNAAARV